MSPLRADGMALATVVLLVLYELWLTLAQRRQPQRQARTAHARLREDWLAAISAQPDSELLAVQTLRNSLMSATMIASTSVLGLMGAVTLASPTLRMHIADDAGPAFTPRLVMELLLMALLFASLVSSVMAARYYHHVGFICSMPVDSAARQRWDLAGTLYIRRAGLLYSWGLRHLVLVAPVLAFLVIPAAGPVAALLTVAVLALSDRVSESSPRSWP